ncbi:hypothetical protein [Sphingopyxis solisilvae]|uniref:hypothetical protein n=1 Tax=Sphingopyxis solisilvae TaxID=1886788 RepID=UPI0018928F8F|nr:hypothetical protein [Sphingopyxis solisilvae]
MTRHLFHTAAVATLAAASLSVPGPASARSADQPPLPHAGTPTSDPFSGFSTELDVSTEEGKAKTSFNISGYFQPDSRQPSEGSRRNDVTWNAGLSIPIGGKSDLLDKSTLGSLGDGTKLSAGVALLSFRSDPAAIGNPAFLALMEQARAQCVDDAKADATKIAECKALLPSESVVRQHAPWLELQMNRALYGDFWTLGAEGAVSVARYKFITLPNLDEEKDRELGYSAKILFNYYPRDAVSKFKIEAEYSDEAKASDATILCKPVVVTPAEDCKSGAPSGPTREDALVLRTGYARYFPFRTGKAGIGVELTASKDVLSKDWAVEAPVYLTIPGTKLISPGVKIGYGSKDGEEDFLLNLFIKTAFSF